MKIIENTAGGINIHTWIDGVPIEDGVIINAMDIGKIPFVKHIAIMPDAHVGKGADIGSVIATEGYICPSLVGADIACGMGTIKTSLTINDIPESIRHELRVQLERAIPNGRTDNGGKEDKGGWQVVPKKVQKIWDTYLKERFDNLCRKHPAIIRSNSVNHLGTSGCGNHFLEISVDTKGSVWLMVHSGSRGLGAKIASHFIDEAKAFYNGSSSVHKQANADKLATYTRSDEFKKIAKEDRANAVEEFRKKNSINNNIEIPSIDFVYLQEGTSLFDDYVEAVGLCNDFAKYSRQIMLENAIDVMKKMFGNFKTDETINCHHNFMQVEEHFGHKWIVTRKGAIEVKEGQLGIIPGAMGMASFVVKGKGNKDSLNSASHGAGRVMGRNEAKRTFTIEEHVKATEGVECCKTDEVLDETPMAYKNVFDVLKAEEELVEPIVQMKAIICIKGTDK